MYPLLGYPTDNFANLKIPQAPHEHPAPSLPQILDNP